MKLLHFTILDDTDCICKTADGKFQREFQTSNSRKSLVNHMGREDRQIAEKEFNRCSLINRCNIF